MRILSLTTLYPYPKRERHGIFVENRLRALSMCGHEIKVIAPIPWFPLSHQVFGDYARYANPPLCENRHGIQIQHPQYLLIPQIGMRAAVGRLEVAFEKALIKTIKDGFQPDVLDAHYLYPDGVAAARVAARHGFPIVLTARGSDVTLLPRYPAPKRMILDAVRSADHVITVAEALREDLINLGADPAQVTTIRNGVNTDLFTPEAPRAAAMPAPDGHPLLLSVGHLIQRKGHDLILWALRDLPHVRLVIVGGGPEEPALRRLAERLKIADRVIFAGEQPHHELPGFYAAADLFVLGSDREGWPNVLLESMACGTPCAVTPAGGVAEVITAPEAGMVAAARHPKELEKAIRQLLASPRDRQKTRLYAEQFGWRDVAADVEKIWQRAARRSPATGWGETVSPSSKDHPKTKYLFTVDTEELFDWQGDHMDWRLPPIEALNRLQEAAEESGTRPLYVVTSPLLEDDKISERLAEFVREGRASCGLHLHGWSTPPTKPQVTNAETFQFHLDPDLHHDKLQNILTAFRARFGMRAIAHRAGRYGIAPWILDQLATEGVMLDFSPSAGFDFRPSEGPDFLDFSPEIRRRDTPQGTQWVIPVSGTRFVRGAGLPITLRPNLTGMSRYLASTFTVPVRLSPEGNDVAVMQKVTRHLVNSGLPLLTPTIHLSSICAGATSYARDEDGVDIMLKRVRDYFAWAQSQGIVATDLQTVSTDLGVKIPTPELS